MSCGMDEVSVTSPATLCDTTEDSQAPAAAGREAQSQSLSPAQGLSTTLRHHLGNRNTEQSAQAFSTMQLNGSTPAGQQEAWAMAFLLV
jgi:hypothetical protein